jgi:hypothetical protein
LKDRFPNTPVITWSDPAPINGKLFVRVAAQ